MALCLGISTMHKEPFRVAGLWSSHFKEGISAKKDLKP
jgi:hypothetical protein